MVRNRLIFFFFSLWTYASPQSISVFILYEFFGELFLYLLNAKYNACIGMLSSASLNDTKFGLYEPSHGSAPDIAGQDIANPIATVLSAAMMLRFTFDLDKEAAAVEQAVQQVLTEGYRTADIFSAGCKKVGTAEMGDLIAARVN